MSREVLTIGDRVIASLITKIIGTIVDKNSFGEVLIEWPDGNTNWVKRRHLLPAAQLEFMGPQK